jgi:hypothetical protein
MYMSPRHTTCSTAIIKLVHTDTHQHLRHQCRKKAVRRSGKDARNKCEMLSYMRIQDTRSTRFRMTNSSPLTEAKSTSNVTLSVLLVPHSSKLFLPASTDGGFRCSTRWTPCGSWDSTTCSAKASRWLPGPPSPSSRCVCHLSLCQSTTD